MAKKVAVVGAGMAGLACARVLHEAGHDVQVFEKSRGPGGRMSTRWLDMTSSPPVGFDHGAQYFQANHPEFQKILMAAAAAGAVAQWDGQVVDLGYARHTPHAQGAKRWVGTPGMSSLGRYLAEGLTVRTQLRVAGIVSNSEGYQLTLHATDGTVKVESGYDAVLSAIPAEQSKELWQGVCSELADRAASVQSTVTWSVMVELAEPLKVPYDGAFVVDSPLGWLARDCSKPGRAAGERWVLQATAPWSASHKDAAASEVLDQLLDVFQSAVGVHLPEHKATAHRWLYSLPLNPTGEVCYLDEQRMLGACGDWMSEARVEDAFLSGHALGGRLLLAWNEALV